MQGSSGRRAPIATRPDRPLPERELLPDARGQHAQLRCGRPRTVAEVGVGGGVRVAPAPAAAGRESSPTAGAVGGAPAGCAAPLPQLEPVSLAARGRLPGRGASSGERHLRLDGRADRASLQRGLHFH